MAVPKKRKSKSKVRTGKAGKKQLDFISITSCTNCGAPTQPHRVCISCGYYGGRIHSLKNNTPTEEAIEETTAEA